MNEAPTVYCPEEEREVPVWYCLGSLTKSKPLCPNLVRAVIHGSEKAEVECKKKEVGHGESK